MRNSEIVFRHIFLPTTLTFLVLVTVNLEGSCPYEAHWSWCLFSFAVEPSPELVSLTQPFHLNQYLKANIAQPNN